MNDGIYKIGPVYSSRVKISDWFEQFLQYPLDNPGRKGVSHYKSFGPTNEVFIPKSTTQEMMEQCRNVHKVTTKGLKHPMINFTSYPLIENGKAFSNIKIVSPKNKGHMFTETTYRYSYYDKRSIVSEEQKCKDIELHPLLNRLPKNDFEMASQTSQNMFMDDHFTNLSEQKKCNNFLRQLKKISYVPWLGDYQKINKTNC